MKICGAKVWIYLTGFDIGDLTWMRHSWMPLVYTLKHDFENLDFWGKDDFSFLFFFKMDEAWPNAPSLEMDAWFLEILIFFFFPKWMRHGQMPLVFKLIQIDAWFLKTLIIEEKMIFFFFQNEWGMVQCP